MSPRRSSKKDSPAKLAGRMKRRWRVVLLRSKGEILGTVEAPDVASAKAAAAVQFDLDEIQRRPDHGAGAWLSDGRCTIELDEMLARRNLADRLSGRGRAARRPTPEDSPDEQCE